MKSDNFTIELKYYKEKIEGELLQGYYIKMSYNGHEKEDYSVKLTKDDYKLKLLSLLHDKLKKTDIPIKLISNFIKNKEDLNKLLLTSKYSKISNKLSELDITFVVDNILDVKFNNLIENERHELLKYIENLKEVNNINELIVLEKVNRSDKPLKSKVAIDEFTEIAKKCFDFEFNGISEFYPYNKPQKIPTDFKLGVIVGASGSGKSTLSKEFGEEELITWDESKAIVSHFENEKDAIDKLSAVGLNSIPTWVKPYHVLSTGEKFRADLARRIKSYGLIDEFTSVVDRNVAKATSTALSKYIKKSDINNLVLVTCHEDIIDWLEPCWVFDTNKGLLYDGKSLRRPVIKMELYETKDYSLWESFKGHHYLSKDLNKASRKFVAVFNGEMVGFSATLPLPSGTIKNAFRGHRTVILPDYQGLGLGMKLSDSIGEIHINEGKRYYSKTSHIRMGTYRENSKLWKPTSKNKKLRTDMKNHMGGNWKIDFEKLAFSHEYIGNNTCN